MGRKSTPSPRRGAATVGRRQTSRSRSRGRSVERKIPKSSVTTRSRSRSRGPAAAAPAATAAGAQVVKKLDESATLVRRRGRTPTRARTPTRVVRATATKTAEIEKQSPGTPAVVVAPAATAPAETLAATSPIAGLVGLKADSASSRLERESPKPVAVSVPVRTAVPAAAPAVAAVAPVVAESPTAEAAAPYHFEFGGSWGAALLIPALPLVVAYTVLCSKNNWNLYCPSLESLQQSISFSCLDLAYAFMAVLAWNALLALLYVLPVGAVVEGAPLKDGTRLQYRCNAFISLVVTLVAFFAENWYHGKSTIGEYITSSLPQLAVASFAFSVLVAALVYLKACRAQASQLSPAATGNVLNDFFMGRELNPRIGSFDLKFFFELRPGLIGWTLINLSLTWSSGSMASRMVAASQILYVADGLWNEPAILTTFDFLQEGFGYMLAFGDLVWVPFLYSIQTQFVADGTNGIQDVRILAAIGLLNVLGIYIFRAANNQKNEFRRNPYNPKLSQLESIATPLGKRLLVGGWWGMSRRPNYLGDLIIALSWALPCGFTHVVPYVHLVTFAVLLVHRLQRDEWHCRQRYGASTWDDYCRRVPYRIVPYVY